MTRKRRHLLWLINCTTILTSPLHCHQDVLGMQALYKPCTTHIKRLTLESGVRKKTVLTSLVLLVCGDLCLKVCERDLPTLARP